ncbi:MAG: heavy metal-associated domain-containing protein [Terriglobia bacterium]
MKSKTQLRVTEMSCQGCVRSIETKLSGLAGVTYAHVNLGEGTAHIEFDDEQTDPAKFIAALDQIGFQATQL